MKATLEKTSEYGVQSWRVDEYCSISEITENHSGFKYKGRIYMGIQPGRFVYKAYDVINFKPKYFLWFIKVFYTGYIVNPNS